MAEVFKVFRGKYVLGIGAPCALVAGESEAGAAYVESFVLAKNRVLTSCRMRFPKEYCPDVDMLLEYGLETVVDNVENIWLELPYEVRGRDVPDIKFQEVPYITLFRLKADFGNQLEFIRDNTLCQALKEKLRILLLLKLQYENLG